MTFTVGKWMLIFGIIFLMCSCSYCVEAGNTTSISEGVLNITPVRVMGKDRSGLLVFPYYSRFLSDELSLNEQVSEIFLDEPTELLEILNHCVHSLGKAARSTKGKSVEFNKIKENTIFVNSIVQKEVKRYLPADTHEGNGQLGQLCELVHTLGMKPLKNAFAFHIAQRIDPVDGEVTTALQDKGFGTLSEEALKRVNKYLHFRSHGIEEKTIADDIGMQGQPAIDDDEDLFKAVIQMHSLEITGLDGLASIEVLHGNNGVHLHLDSNHIIGCDQDPDFPILDGLHIQSLNLSENEIGEILDNFFIGVKGMKEVDLRYNYLKPLSEQIYINNPFRIQFSPQHSK